MTNQPPQTVIAGAAGWGGVGWGGGGVVKNL